MAGDTAPYTSLITSEHNQRPKFMATVAALVQPAADTIETLRSMVAAYDLDTAVGAQLDAIGQWVGVSRILPIPISGVYFTWDLEGLGWDQGIWKGPFDPDSDLVALPDDYYRLLLRATIQNNRWDGTIQQAYEDWDVLFASKGYGILIQDYGNMHMLYALTGPTPDALTLALFRSGVLNTRPAGVHVDGYLTPSVPSTPYFGFDVENASIAGFDVGQWGLAS